MQKTRLGITVGLMGAALYFSGLFGGYVITIILAGYVLLCEENAWLKKAAVKTVAIMMGFSLLGSLIYLIPNAIGVIDSILNVFGGNFYLTFVSNIIDVLDKVLGLAEKLLLIILGLKAFNQGNISVPVIDKLINKYMD